LNGSDVLIIGGPTASGKSSLALQVAERVSGVVINADSMQLYCGLPLLTAQPPAEDLERSPHLLYAGLQPDDTCSAARWRNMALAEIEKAHAEGKTPVIVGGTGFYLKALISGLSPIPDIPADIREKASSLQKELGNPAFHAALAVRDPLTAAKLPPFNTQRLVRAWEVLEATRKSLAEWQSLPPVPPPAHLRFITTTLLPPRQALYQRCNMRFDTMVKTGALEEVSAFMQKIKTGEASAAASLTKALGYEELATYLRGETNLATAMDAAKQATRRYAKRQITWFRHQIAADMVMEKADAEELIKRL
jgi:tRNA dimethylallyltransferase